MTTFWVEKSRFLTPLRSSIWSARSGKLSSQRYIMGGGVGAWYITLFRSKTLLCGSDNILQSVKSECEEYSAYYCHSHITLCLIWIVLCTFGNSTRCVWRSSTRNRAPISWGLVLRLGLWYDFSKSKHLQWKLSCERVVFHISSFPRNEVCKHHEALTTLGRILPNNQILHHVIIRIGRGEVSKSNNKLFIQHTNVFREVPLVHKNLQKDANIPCIGFLSLWIHVQFGKKSGVLFRIFQRGLFLNPSLSSQIPNVERNELNNLIFMKIVPMHTSSRRLKLST